MSIFRVVPAVGDFKSCLTQDHIAAALDTTAKQLAYHLYNQNAPEYQIFTILKASGSDRVISVPPPRVMVWQKALSKYLSDVYERKPSVHGFVKEFGICTNAEVHVNRHLILNIDLRNFFPSIHYGRIRGLFTKYPFNFTHQVASTLARLCTHNSVLPQGAPTSPILSNFICRRLDNALWKLAKPEKCIYTRYADDITFSTNQPCFPPSLVEGFDETLRVVNLGVPLQMIVRDNNFVINQEKVRIRGRSQKQEVTGLTVNKRVNVDRKFISSLRTMLNDWRTTDEQMANSKFAALDLTRSCRSGVVPTLRRHIRGKIEFLRMVRGDGDKVFMKYAIAARRLHQDILAAPVVCNDSARGLGFLRETLWVVLGYDSVGYQVAQGTAFSIKGVGIVSARHIFDDANSFGAIRWTLKRASDPNDEIKIDSYTAEPAVDMTLIGSVASSNAVLRMSGQLCKHDEQVRLVGFPNWNSAADNPATPSSPINQIVPKSGCVYAGVNTALLGGSSGGPVLNAAGEVVGVIANSPTNYSMPNAFITIQSIVAASSAKLVAL